MLTLALTAAQLNCRPSGPNSDFSYTIDEIFIFNKTFSILYTNLI
jgi:hypothetical protein